MHKTILFVEDDPFLSKQIRQVIPPQHQIDVRKDLRTSYEYLEAHVPDLIVLDRVLPDGDGLELVEYVTSLDPTKMVLILSGKAQLHDRIEGLRKGADDYLPKPFSTAELSLRISRLLQSTKHHAERYVEVGPFQLDCERGQVIAGGQLYRMRKREFQILRCLCAHADRTLSRDQLIQQIWPEEKMPSYATIDVYIRRLRMLLGSFGGHITTVKGYGYALQRKR